jgi:MbtH protein
MFENCELWAVVISIEGHYSVWPADKDIPLGWKKEGKEGKKEECLNHIKEVWVDMRPNSLRKTMDEKNSEVA